MSAYYIPIGMVPAPDAPTGLAVTSEVGGRLIISLVQPTGSLVRSSYAEVTRTAGPDWSVSTIVNIPTNTNHAVIEAYPGLTPIWVRAFSVNMFGTASVYTSVVSLTTATGATSALALVPLTTTLATEPAFVWDEHDDLVMTEVPFG